VSLFALADGRRVVPLAAAQDFKRIGDGDIGPNTGGMGAYSPVPWLDDVDELVDRIHRPVVEELARRGAPFVGCLFAGLMITDDGPRVLEFNARFGDPETQVLMPRLAGDVIGALAAAATGEVKRASLSTRDDAAVTVVLAAPDYPERSDYAGADIAGLDDAEAEGAIVFHGGTAVRDGRLVTNGGRILSVTALGPSVPEARERAYAAVDKVTFEGARFRRDIAAVAGA
jgi:phosphoribosylamine--glycine ligase